MICCKPVSSTVQDSRSTIAVGNRQPGGLYNLGEACLAPTQICPRRERYGVRGRFRAPFPFAPVHSRRKSAQSAVRFPVSGAVAVDNRGRRSFTWRSLRSGRGMPRPYTDMLPTGPRYGVRGRFRAPFPFAPAHSQRQSAKSAVRCSLGPEHSRSTIGVDGRSPGGLYEVGEARLAPTQICPRRERDGVGVAFHGTPLCSSAPT